MAVKWTVFYALLILRCGLLEGSAEECHTLYLLNVIPYPDRSDLAGWDRGLEVAPAAHLATKHINNRTDLLNGLELEVIDIASEACGISIVSEGYVSPFREILDSPCISGVIGFFCSTVTESVAPIISHPSYGYVQLASSGSPLLRNNAKLPYIFKVISSTEVFNNAMIAFMDVSNWTTVSVIYNWNAGVYFRSTGSNFDMLVTSNPNKTLMNSIPIFQSETIFSDIFTDNKASIVRYHSVTVEESANIMCEAYKQKQLWPMYVYVFQSRTIEDLLSNVSCTREDMLTAIEGVFFLQYRLQTTQNDSNLVSGMSYEDYDRQYQEELWRIGNETRTTLEKNIYANSLYDQVWAFALAMNNSLHKTNLTFTNSSFTGAYETTPNLRQKLSQELKEISFQGVTGQMDFDESQTARTFVNIFQVRNGTQVLIGLYNSRNMSISFLDDFDLRGLPGDTLDTEPKLVPWWLGAIVLLAQGALFVIIMLNTILLVYLRKRPEIKSSSLYVSLIILSGCFSLCLSPVFDTAYNAIDIKNAHVFTLLCNLELWFSLNGLDIVIVALLFRLLRIFHVFRSFRTTGKFWSDKYVVTYILMVCSVLVVFLSAWSIFDPLRYSTTTAYVNRVDLPPYILKHAECTSKLTAFWYAISFFWIGLILIIVTFFAVSTRRIKRKHFKDTKKVNAFVFAVCIILFSLFPLSYILLAADQLIAGYMFKWLTFFLVSFLCQIFIFMPKIFPLLTAKSKPEKPHVAALARSLMIAKIPANLSTSKITQL